MEWFIEQATRLYEREQREVTPLLGTYVRRWMGWAQGGLGDKEKPRTEAGLSNFKNDSTKGARR